MKKNKQNSHEKSKIFYDKKADILWLMVKSGPEEEYKEVAPGVSVELGKKGELLGIEILNASKVLGEKFRIKPGSSVSRSSVIAHKIR